MIGGKAKCSPKKVPDIFSAVELKKGTIIEAVITIVRKSHQMFVLGRND